MPITKHLFYAEDAGAVLAQRLLATLTRNHDKPIHFIGHGLGAVVNAYAARRFLDSARGTYVPAQMTVLDYPARTLVPGEQPIPANLVSTLLEDLLNNDRLRIDNYYSHDGLALGAATEGRIYDHPAFVLPNVLRGELFAAEGSANDHAGVHQWYRWSMDPNVFNSTTYCNGAGFTLPTPNPNNLNASLNPCQKGWHWALLGPGGNVVAPNNDQFPTGQLGATIDVTVTDLPLLNPRPNPSSPCSFDAVTKIATCPADQFGSISFTVDIPPDATFLDIEYAFEDTSLPIDPPDGDYGTITLNGQRLAIFGEGSVPGNGTFQRSGPILLPSAASGSGATSLALGDAVLRAAANVHSTVSFSGFPEGGNKNRFRLRDMRMRMVKNKPMTNGSACTEVCFGKKATICGTDGNDRLDGTRRADVIVGRGGSDRIFGGRGNDLLCGGPGRDTLKGGRGRDRMNGGAGRDTCRGNSGTDTARSCAVVTGVP